MGDIDMAAARALCDAATPGPWVVGEEIDGVRAGRRTVVRGQRGSGFNRRIVTVDQTRPHEEPAEPNVEFIAAARTLIPALLDALAAAEARTRELEATVQREIYAAWDEGNAVGLDGWVGPERGTDPDGYAVRARDQYVDNRLAALRGSDV